MKGLWIVLVGAGAAALLFAAEQPKKEPTELDKLKAKVALLEGRIDQLEARLFVLSQGRKTGLETPSMELPRDPAPPNIGELEVNGLKIYKVPLSGGK